MESDIVRVYRDFYACFCRIVQGLTVVPNHNAALGFRPSQSTLSLSSPICLISWPCAKDPSNNVDIVVNYQMTLAQQGTKNVCPIESSKASVLYFLGGIEKRPSVHILRFDYHPSIGMNDGDPLFHAQIGGKMDLSPKCLPKHLQDRWRYGDKPKSVIESHVHIPTPRMLLPDLLCFIVADHLRCRVHDLVEDARRPLEALAKLVSDDSYRGLVFWAQISASNWYRRSSMPSAKTADGPRSASLGLTPQKR